MIDFGKCSWMHKNIYSAYEEIFEFVDYVTNSSKYLFFAIRVTNFERDRLKCPTETVFS